MMNNDTQLKRYFSLGALRNATFAGLLMIAVPASASNQPAAAGAIDKIALTAYCSEAQSKSTLLADGLISYEQVVDRASERALSEHPGVFRDSSGWKAHIDILLDQYGDEPRSELCGENHDSTDG